MSYTKTNWANNSTPAINASNLTKIENQLTALTSVTDTNLKSTLLDMFYPVGSIYTSTTINSSTASVSGKAGCPIADIGGTWQRITGKFLLAATDNGSSGASQAAGNTGGSATNDFSDKLHYTSTQYGLKSPSDGYQDRMVVGLARPSGTTNDECPYPHFSNLNNMPPYLSVYMWKRTG